MTYKKYFAYGSNMFQVRLQKRVSSAKALGVYTLKAHDLRFHKPSDQDGSGKCDAYETGDDADFVVGRLFDIAESEEEALDKAEGLGNGYEKKIVTVVGVCGSVEDAFTYYAMQVNASLRPYTWYKAHVLAGAREAYLPGDYIEKIEAVAADKDPDLAREKKELRLHC